MQKIPWLAPRGMTHSCSSPHMDSIRITEAIGSYKFTIDHSKTKDMGFHNWIYSPEFRVGEHDWTIRYYPRGETKDGVDYISVYVGLQRVSVDVSATVECVLLNKNGTTSSTTSRTLSRTFSSGGKENWGWGSFLPRTNLEETYVKDDFFVLKVTLTLKDESCSGARRNASPVGFPCKRIKKFREENVHTDVTFDIDGSLFAAHRLILAAHSPVFEAELFGSMAESNMDCIKILEMTPSVFKAMLDFMYSGSLPVTEELNKDNQKPMSLISFFQDLLVAADRYAVDKLRSMCEHKLIGCICLADVLPLLELAEKHSCSDLKADCLKFIANKDNLVNLVLTEGCIKLLHNHPSLLAELKEMASK